MNTTNIHPPLRKWQAEALPLALDCVLKQLAGESEPQVISACTGSGKSRLIAELVAARAALLLEEQVIVVTTPTRRLVRQLSATLAEHISQPIAQHYTSAKWRGKARIIVCCNASAPGLAKMLAAAGKTIALWIADEAHKTETPEITRFCEDAPALTCIGFTATPFRSSNKETLQRFDAELYRYTPTMALADGCLVPWRAVTWTLPGTELDESCITMIQSHYTRGPGVVNARSIDDAESFAVKLSKKGIKSSAIHSKLTTAEQDALLEQLRTGELNVLVYPSLLSEGVDLPWLAWGCFRLRVGASVRFIQELGRFLRTNAGKTEAVILDPHGLLEDKAITLNAALGWNDAEEDDTTPEDEDEDEDEEKEGSGEREEQYATVADALAAYSRNMLLVAISDGIVGPDKSPGVGAQRKSATTAAQYRYLARLVRSDYYLEHTHRDPIKEMLKRKIIPSKGAASDLITLFEALADLGCGWTPGNRLNPPSVEDFEAQQRARAEEPIHVAAVQRKTKAGNYAVAIVASQGGYEVYSASKVTSRTRGIHPTALTLAGIRLVVMSVRDELDNPTLQTSDKIAEELIAAGQYATSKNIDINAELDRRERLPPHTVGKIHEQANRANSGAWRILSKLAPRSK
jgi:superfamily II DNA or RNA helicase